MSERKVINKYIPPDFDPDKIMPRGGGYSLKDLGITSKKPGRTVRLMLPFSMRCTTCLDYIYKGRKFNARKETCAEKYLGRVEIYRFHIKCPSCYAEITYRTDPQNADYAAEHGCTRNYEPWKEQEKESKALRIKREFEEKYQPMKAVESKAIDSKREIDLAEAIENLQSSRDQLESIQNDPSILRNHLKGEEEDLYSEEIEDEELIMQTFGPIAFRKATEDTSPHTELSKSFSPPNIEIPKTNSKDGEITRPIIITKKPPPICVKKSRLDPKSIGIRPRK